MSTKTAINKAIKQIGLIDLAKKMNMSYQAIKLWRSNNRMPCTEYSGRTTHSMKIEKITNGEVTVEDLLGYVPVAVDMKRMKKK